MNAVEFYNTPEGDVMIHEYGSAVRRLEEKDVDDVRRILSKIMDLYPEAYKSLSELYTKGKANRIHYEFQIVSRFLRCNFGEYDSHRPDIDADGIFHFEEVKCPLRGECMYEGVICKPKIGKLTEREREVAKYIADGIQAVDIAELMNISVNTVNKHRENIKVKLGTRNVIELANIIRNQ